MKKKVLSAALAAAFAFATPMVASASSHREAPFITKSPKVDGTDFYLFNSYEPGRGNFVTLIANYQPLQDAYGGPNYFSLDPEALYEIHIDHTGDAVEDISFQFRFNNALANGGITLPIAAPDGSGAQDVAIPLINAAPLGVSDGGTGFTSPGPLQNVLETYTVGVVRGGRRSSAPRPSPTPRPAKPPSPSRSTTSAERRSPTTPTARTPTRSSTR